MKIGMTCSQECSRCKEVKSLDEFNRDKSRKDGRQRYCKTCRNASRREWNAKKKLATGWIVYVLPQENYAGISNNIERRIYNHRVAGKNTTHWYVYEDCKTPAEALMYEAKLHMEGYEGCTYKEQYI